MPHVVVMFSDDELKQAADYYYRKGTIEVKQFVKKEAYEKISSEKDGILYYIQIEFYPLKILTQYRR